MNDIRNFIFSIPKSEIHLHLEGVASIDTIWELKNKNNITLKGINSKEDLVRAFQVKSFEEFLNVFINVIQVTFQKEEDIRYLIKDARNYLKRNNIYYAEIFFAPSKFIQSGLSYDLLADILDAGAEDIQKKDKISIKYIIDVSRTFGPENAMKNLQQMLDHPKPSIIGIGLGGAEKQGPASDYAEVFLKASKQGLKLVAHAGEVMGPESIWSALKDLNVQRIGHGISSIYDDELIEYLKNNQIPLEICPTSNFFTGVYSKDYKTHPVKKLVEKGVCVTINTDDPTIFGVELIEEYARLYENNVFTKEQLVLLIKNNLFSTFLSDQLKADIWKNIEKEIFKI